MSEDRDRKYLESTTLSHLDARPLDRLAKEMEQTQRIAKTTMRSVAARLTFDAGRFHRALSRAKASMMKFAPGYKAMKAVRRLGVKTW